MDARRVLLFFLLVICTINGTFANQNDWGRPNHIRRIRRISEYLVPPPPPRFHPPGRIPRLANLQSTSQSGYLTQLMNWLNPFGSNSSPERPPPPPPPLPSQPEATNFIQSDSLPRVTTYNGPPPVDYEKPPLPSPSINDPSGYPAPIKTKNCNSCNKVPWMPIQDTYKSEFSHLNDLSHSPPPLHPQDGQYLPKNPEVPHDAYHAASHEVTAPNLPSTPPLSNGGQDSFFNPLINPHLFPGALPPLFKAVDFNYPVQVTPDENSGYLNSPPPSISGNEAPIENGPFLDVAGPTYNNGHNRHPEYPDPLDHSVDVAPQELGYVNPGTSNGEFENFNRDNAAHGDLSSSGTQVSHGHASAASNNEELHGITGSDGNGNFLTNEDQIDQNPPSSYGISNLDRIPNNYEYQYNDLSSSANVAEGSHAPIDESSSGDSINFEESPLLDFTHKGESRTHSSSIPSTSNAFAGFQSTEITGTTVVPRDEIFGTRQSIDSTESHRSTHYFEIIDSLVKESKISNNTIQDTDRESSRNILNDDVVEETLSDNINLNLHEISGHQGAMRNKQVQVIIPYTSQYTPLPFHPSHERVTDASESNHDSYVGEESRSRIEVVIPPNSSHLFQSSRSLSDLLKDIKKSDDTKADNSIDLHKLQKNIDNWTIQEYSRGTTASTVRPTSSNPYLFPSKKIPNEYFTTSKPFDYVADSHNDNSKTFTLDGFSFNDEEYTGSASNRMENSRVVKIKKLTESSTDTSIATENMWQSFPVGISSVNRERVYIVTPQPSVTTPRSNSEYKQETASKEAERKESKTFQSDIKKMKMSDTFESIEKAYQVLPQAVNNLAVASTGPESVSLWSIMEEFGSPVGSDYDNNDTQPPMLHSRLSKESRARR